MVTVNINKFIKIMRQRQNVEKDDFINENGCYLSLSQIESGKQNPKPGTRRDILEKLEIPEDLFFCPYLRNQPISAYRLRSSLLRAVDYGNMHNKMHPRLPDLFRQLESCDGFDTGIHRQFFLSIKVQVLLQQCHPYEEILPLIYEGISISFPGFNVGEYEGTVLAFEEPDLLCSLAKIFALKGELPAAIKLLENVHVGLCKLPISDREKGKKLAPILLTLARFQMQNKDFSEGVEMCDYGNDISLFRRHGQYTPDFLFIKAHCLYGLGNIDGCRSMLEQAFFGFALLHKEEQLQQVLAVGKEQFGITIETYGVENLKFNRIPLIGNRQGEIESYDRIGELIGRMLDSMNISVAKLCDGICTDDELRLIVTGKTASPNPWTLEAILQRLGRNMGLYISTFYSAEDFDNKCLRDEIVLSIGTFQKERAKELLKKLESKKSYGERVNRQFILYANATLFGKDNGNKEEYLSMLYKAIRITISHFNEKEISHYRLTHNEISIINLIANHYAATGEIERAIEIFSRLRTSMDKYYVDEAEKVRLYGSIMYNFSIYLGTNGQYDDALDVIADGEAFALRHDSLNILAILAINKACDLLEIGSHNESIPFFAMAFFGAVMFGKYRHRNDVSVIRDYVKKNLGLRFTK